MQQSKKTVGTYSETEDLIAAIQGEFGSDYTIADWNNLVAIEDIDEWINCMELEDETERFMLKETENISIMEIGSIWLATMKTVMSPVIGLFMTKLPINYI